MEKDYYTTKELAEVLNISVSTLEYWRNRRKNLKIEIGPPFIKIEGTIRYKISDVDLWLLQMEF